MWCTEILIINRKTPKMIVTHVIQPDRYINGGGGGIVISGQYCEILLVKILKF